MKDMSRLRETVGGFFFKLAAQRSKGAPMISLRGFSAGFAALMVLLPAASGSDGTTGVKPFSGKYTFYSRDVGDWGPPTAHDTKIWLEISGPAARRMYNELGPKSDGLCGGRERGDLGCIKDEAGAYSCMIGIDLRKGKSVVGSTC